MLRSKSWPLIWTPEAEKKGTEESSFNIEQAKDSHQQKEAECKKLRYELSKLASRAEKIEMENLLLTTENKSFKEQRKASSDLLKFLELEWSQHKLQMREIDIYMSNLEKKQAKLERENRALSWELSRKNSVVAETHCSKKNPESKPQQTQESIEKRRKEDRIRQLMQESDTLRDQLQDIEHQLMAKEAEEMDFKQLRTENHEMQLQISQMVQQNIQLHRQLNDFTPDKAQLEQQSIEIQEKMENKNMDDNQSRESSSVPIIHCIAQKGVEGVEENKWEDNHVHDKEFSKQILSSETHPSGTTKEIYLTEKLESTMCNAQSRLKNEVEQPIMSNPHDAMEEYLHLTAAAVKISFSKVPISSDELIERAKQLPFYRVHDELRQYMEEKLRELESCQNKQDQDHSQQQKPPSKKKSRLVKRLNKNSLWTHAIKHKPNTKGWRERYNTTARIQRMGLKKNRKTASIAKQKSNKGEDKQHFSMDFNAHLSVFKKARHLLRPLSTTEVMD